ncbi:DUF885 domain-containing protein [Henriciella mobilis]|uniref:DUF885 domain-containing protein n=1 Tax=Henriciella mobilis TaxID=2305467 RepID=UPI000E66B45E|nr:DUF885 domain-containing protein [Henriciella mobilis]RIJ17921.1 DUF885 domain-containing protein [Henriciella mobilis]RIJ25268.1 DUF885 domain-containing protein [Henriciella mobilis]
MKPVISALLGIFALTSAASAQDFRPSSAGEQANAEEAAPLASIIAEYEAMVSAVSPGERAEMEDRAPRRWPDVSRTRVAQLANHARLLKGRLAALGQPDSIDTKILDALLDELIMQDTFDTARIPFTGDWGFHAEPFFAASSLRLNTVEDAEAWIARLNDLPRYFDQNIHNMRRGLRTGWVSHTDPLETVMEQVAAQIVDHPEDSGLWAPFETLPPGLDGSTKEGLRAAGRKAVTRAVEATRRLQRFLEDEYAGQARPEPGIGSLPDGKAYYVAAIAHHTAGAGYTPEAIHALGEAEVARIRAEMHDVMEAVNYPGTFEEFLVFLRSDPQFYAKSPEDLLEKAALIAKRLDAILPAYFGKLPRLTYGVEPVPASIAPGYTTGRYSGGDPARGIPGTYLVNTYALDQRPLYELPALSAHEAVPGHHLQIALAQEMEDMPRFRRSYYATAFGEGWGLYAETLAGEAGIYRTPYEKFGALSYEMWRACRLVADTGMHWYGWSREEAEACFKENSALAPLNIQTEVTRYIGWPGQATAYKVGELKILELRARAKDALGEDFDIRAFHDVLLGAGSMPLDALEDRIDTWIEQTPDGQSPLAGNSAP